MYPSSIASSDVTAPGPSVESAMQRRHTHTGESRRLIESASATVDAMSRGAGGSSEAW